MDIRRKDRKRLEEDPVAKRKDSIYLFSKHRDVAIIASLGYISAIRHPEDYPWSSYRTILRMTDDRITQPEKTLAFFKQSIFYYREFVEDATHKYKINENMIQKEIGEDASRGSGTVNKV